MKDIDKQIAEKVMGWEKRQAHFHPSNPTYWFDGDERQMITAAWSPSTNIAHAWQVVEKMRTIHFKWFEMAHRPNGYTCNFTGDPKHTEFDKTAPLAICKAALKVIES